jgi:hypothetical protein
LLDEIRANTVEDGSKYLRRFQVDITDAREQNVARVYKTLHIRRRAGHPDPGSMAADPEFFS